MRSEKAKSVSVMMERRDRLAPKRACDYSLLCLLLPLAGCAAAEGVVAPSIPAEDYKMRHPIILADEPRTLEVLVEPRTGRFDRKTAARLREFAELYRQFGRGPITIMPPAWAGSPPPTEPVRRAV